MATKLRFITNVGTYNPQLNNIHVAVVSEAIVPSLNGKLLAFAVRGQDAGAGGKIDLAVQTQQYLTEAVTVSKIATFPTELLSDVLSWSEYASLSLIIPTGENYVGTRIDPAAFTNDITMLSPGFKAKALGEILGGGVTQAEAEDLLAFDLNDDGTIGEIKKLNSLLQQNLDGSNPPPKTGFAFLDSIKDSLDGINTSLWPVVKWGAIGIGANFAVKAVSGRPLVGKKGYILS